MKKLASQNLSANRATKVRRFNNSRRLLSSFTFLLTCIIVSASTATQTQAQIKYDPEHPEVKEMINAGLRFLQAREPEGLGEAILFGTAAYKASLYTTTAAEAKKHPLVISALEWVDRIFDDRNYLGRSDFNSNYIPALTLIFLLDIDAEEYRPQIKELLDYLIGQQQESGSWGYRTTIKNGDTSQMQYVGLALWLASKSGYDVEPNVGKDALNWMVDNQSSGGGWIYTIPPVRRTGGPTDLEERLSLAAAGSGTVYVLSEWLQLASKQSVKVRQAKAMAELARDLELRLPPSVTEYNPEAGEEVLGNAKVAFDIVKLRTSMARSNSYFNANFRPDPEKWTYYFLYAFERYASLRELVDGDVSDGWNDWYDQGVVSLKKSQGQGGNWPTPSIGENSKVSTALAILFLTRSMQLSLQSKVIGVLKGKEGFGEGDMEVDARGNITERNIQRDLTSMLEKLDETSDADLIKRYKEQLAKLIRTSKGASRTAQLAKLRELVTHVNGDLRLAAVEVIGKTRDLDNVPALIFAMTDPDLAVAKAAHNSLRFISRKIDSFSMTGEPSKNDYLEMKRKWVDWYKSIKPDARLIEEPGQDN